MLGQLGNPNGLTGTLAIIMFSVGGWGLFFWGLEQTMQEVLIRNRF